MLVFSLAKPIVRELHTLGSFSEGSTIGIKLLIEAEMGKFHFIRVHPLGHTHFSFPLCDTHIPPLPNRILALEGGVYGGIVA